MYTIKSPVANYGGVTAGVQFTQGVGQTDDVNAVEWMRAKGYEVSEEAPPKPLKEQEPLKEAGKKGGGK